MADLLPRADQIVLADRIDFRLGDALIRPSTRTIEGPAGAVTGEPRIIQVLLVIADAAGEVVSRDELIRRCWNGRIVGDDSIHRAIAEIRRLTRISGSAFGIETVPRIGFRLIGVTLPPAKAEHRQGVSRRVMLVAGGGFFLSSAAALWLIRERQDDEFDQLVVQAREAMSFGAPESFPQASGLMARAVRARPHDAQGWGILAVAQARSAEIMPEGQRAAQVVQAERSAGAALALDGRQSDARLAMLYLQSTLLDMPGRDLALRGIIADDPKNFLAIEELVVLLQAAGLTRESVGFNERALAIARLSPTALHRRALKQWILGDNDAAYRTIDRAAVLWPHHPYVWNSRFLLFAFTGRTDAALAMLDEREQPVGSFAPPAIKMWRPALKALGNPTDATRSAARAAILSGARTSAGLAAHGVMMLGALGLVDDAFSIANGVLLAKGEFTTVRTINGQIMNSPGWRYTQWLFTPPSAILRTDPRFGPLCDGIGLTAYWRLRGVRPDYLGQHS